MSNYIHDLAERVLSYWTRVEELEANPVPPPDPNDFKSTLNHVIGQPRIPKGAGDAFSALERVSGCPASAMDRAPRLYAETIFPYSVPEYTGVDANAADIERSVYLAKDLVTLKYLFRDPSKWPEHKLLSVSKGFPEGAAKNALAEFYKRYKSDSLLSEFKESDDWFYKPSYGDLVRLRMPTTDPSADKQLIEICADIVRICEQHSIYRFRKTKSGRIEFDWDFLRFERPDDQRRGAVRLLLPPWLAGMGMKDHFPRNALAVVLEQEQRKASGIPEHAKAKFIDDNTLLDACANVVKTVDAAGKNKNYNQLYRLINAECERLCGSELSSSPDPVAVGKTIRNRLRNINSTLESSFADWCNVIKSQ